MFKNLFKKKEKALPEFLLMKSYANRDKYFVRTHYWDWLNEEHICVMDKVDGKPKMFTFEFWPQEIFLDATGKMTVSGLLETAIKQYIDSNMPVPDNLDAVLIESFELLAEEMKLIEFKDEAIAIPVEIELPLSAQLKTN